MSEQPHPIDLEVGRIIREQRLLKGLSQSELGTRIRVSYPQIQKYERGANRVTISTLVEITQALDIEISLFFRSIVSKDARADDLTTAAGTVLSSARQGVLLHSAFKSIKDDHIRMKVLGLVQAIAGLGLEQAMSEISLMDENDY